MYRFTNIYVLAAFGTIGGGKVLLWKESIGDKCIADNGFQSQPSLVSISAQ